MSNPSANPILRRLSAAGSTDEDISLSGARQNVEIWRYTYTYISQYKASIWIEIYVSLYNILQGELPTRPDGRERAAQSLAFSALLIKQVRGLKADWKRPVLRVSAFCVRGF